MSLNGYLLAELHFANYSLSVMTDYHRLWITKLGGYCHNISCTKYWRHTSTSLLRRHHARWYLFSATRNSLTCFSAGFHESYTLPTTLGIYRPNRHELTTLNLKGSSHEFSIPSFEGSTTSSVHYITGLKPRLLGVPSCRGQPWGSPKKPGEPCLKPAKNKSKTHLSPKHARRARPTLRWPPRPTGVAQSKAPSSGFRLARGSTLPSSGFRLTRGLTPTSSGFRLARRLTLPRAGSASLEGSHHLERVPPRSRTHAAPSGFRLARGSLTSTPAPTRRYGHLML
jgi:hypothetical protein